jgi:hypothetical protein
MSEATKKYITLAQASEIYQMSESALRRRIDEGVLPAYKPSRAILVDPRELELFIKKTRVVAS